jgi:hypothetical protein
MGNRTQRRVKTVLPVRLGGTGTDGQRFVAVAHTIDISSSGARLGGVVAPVAFGATIELQYQYRKAKFEVLWVGRSGDKQQVGLKCLEPGKDLWGTQLDSGNFEDDYVAPKKTSDYAAERKQPRYEAQASVDLITQADMRTVGGELQNLSAGGCYVRTFQPLDVNTKVEVLIQLDGARINAFGIVRSAQAEKGMGLEFTAFRAPEDELTLHAKVADLAGGEKVPLRLKEYSELAKRLQAVTKELYEVEEAIKSAEIEPEILSEFREAVGQVRSTSWAVQKFFEIGDEQKPSEVLAFLNTERIRLATRLCQHLNSDIKKQEIDRQSPYLEGLLETVETLFTRLAGFEFRVADLGGKRKGAGR